jgi:hypothetical protein
MKDWENTYTKIKTLASFGFFWRLLIFGFWSWFRFGFRLLRWRIWFLLFRFREIFDFGFCLPDFHFQLFLSVDDVVYFLLLLYDQIVDLFVFGVLEAG